MATDTAKVAEMLAESMDRIRSPGLAIAVVTRDGVEWQGFAGVERASASQEVAASTSFLWFSMTKIATATAVMQLVDDHKIDLDASAASYLPDLDGLEGRITVRHLLSHSSGISNPPPLRWVHPAAETPPDPRALIERLLSRHGKPKFEPGDHSAYTNIGYLVLGELIAEVSGRPYTQYVLDMVMRPIGATSTGFALDSAHAATGHHPRRDPFLPIARLLMPRWVLDGSSNGWRMFSPFLLDGSAYGGLVGPVGEAARLAAVHLGGGALDGARILSEESAMLMQQIRTEGRKFDLGLGWFREHKDSKRGRTFVEHQGGGPAFGTVMRLYPDREIAVAAMANVSSNRFDHERLMTAVESVDES